MPSNTVPLLNTGSSGNVSSTLTAGIPSSELSSASWQASALPNLIPQGTITKIEKLLDEGKKTWSNAWSNRNDLLVLI